MFLCSIDDGIELRPLEECHVQDLYMAVDRNRERLRPWLAWVDLTHGAEDCRAFIRTAQAQYAAGEALHLGVWDGAGW